MALFSKKKNLNAKATKQKTSMEQEGVHILKEFIAPPAIKLESNWVQIGRKYARTMFTFTYPRFLKTAWLAPIINLNRMYDVSIFIHPSDTGVILKGLEGRLAKIEAEMQELEQKGYVRNPALETAFQDIEQLRDQLQQGQDRFFRFGLYFTIYADDPKELTELEKEFTSILENRLVYTRIATFQQEQGFNSSLPLAEDQLLVDTQMNTGPISTTFPFVSSELSSNKGILYGINRHNNSLIIFDRFSMENANSVIFGKSGGGKSYATKLEVIRSLMVGTDVLIIDPENEYQYLAETVGGTFLKISLTSPHHINPFDLPPMREDDDPATILRENFIDLVSMIRIMLGGLSTEEDALIDKAVRETYASRDITETSSFEDKTPPLLSDLEQVLGDLEGGKELALKLSRFTEGRFAGFFNQQSNVDINRNLVVFNIRDMEEDLRPIAMYIILSYIWKRVRVQLKKRLLFVDEAWWLLQHEESAAFLFSMAKRARKYFLGLTTITQDINDFMKSRYGEPIITNSSIQLLFKQAPATIDVVQRTFNLTDEEKYILLQSKVGEGIFFAGLKHAAVQVVASYSEDQIVTSDPAQLMKIEEAKRSLLEQGQSGNDAAVTSAEVPSTGALS